MSSLSGWKSILSRIRGTPPPPSPLPTTLLNPINEVSRNVMVPYTDRWHTLQVRVEEEDVHRQLSDVISRKYDVTRKTMQRLIREGKVQVSRGTSVTDENGRIRTWTPRENMRMQFGDLVVMTELNLQPRLPKTEEVKHVRKGVKWSIKDSVLYEDERIIVINKPYGVPMHAGPKCKAEHVEGHLEELRRPTDPHAPLIVHRLDRDTTGVLLLARTRSIAHHISTLFNEAHSQQGSHLDKIYWALCKGRPREDERSGELVANLYRMNTDTPHERMTTFSDRKADCLDEGKVAITKYRWMHCHRQTEKNNTRSNTTLYSLMELRPVTGRQHQLRVQLAEQLRLPIVGDYKYCPAQPDGLRMHLHCYRISLKNWLGEGKPLTITAPLPSHFIKTMEDYPLCRVS